MGGSFLNETQVRLIMVGSLGSGHAADIKAELPLYNVHLTILTHLLVPHSREYYPGIIITTYLLSPGAESVPVSALLLHLPPV